MFNADRMFYAELDNIPPADIRLHLEHCIFPSQYPRKVIIGLDLIFPIYVVIMCNKYDYFRPGTLEGQ